ncbi:hypothetical protein FA15DRAFT_672120 [Coprinopsis marcescibilis]|uniref:TPR-like protein n=1 Tax=Coprinopsis marcescibilis TaxID=230819 RepID=A0A5C3L138_COPMA|nr:hypothetical protein FA15DRAFT_672120 [Coprinopsis marcescibilis]
MIYRRVHESTYQLAPLAGPGVLNEEAVCDGKCRSRLEIIEDGVGLEEREKRRAWALYHHANLIHQVWVPDERFSVLAESLETFHRLAETDPAKYEPALSDILNNYAVWLGSVGRIEDALRMGQEAVEIRRRLVAAHPEKYEAHLASSLCNLARYFVPKRMEKAVSPVLESLTIRRRISSKYGDGLDTLIAESLHHYALYLLLVRKNEEALEPAHQAVVIRSRLAEQDPENFEHHLAWSLFRLSECYFTLDRHDDAISVVLQTIELQRHLVRESLDPSPFQELLSSSLFHYARCLSHMGRPRDALVPGLEALCARRVLFSKSPEGYARSYADSIGRVAYDLGYCPRQPSVQLLEGLLIYTTRRLSATYPDIYEPVLAECYFRRALSFSSSYASNEATQAQRESIAIRRRYAKKDPTTYEPALAESLHHYATDLSRISGFGSKDAIEPEKEALGIYRRLAEQDATKYQDCLAQSLFDLSNYLISCNRYAEAVPYAESSLDMRRRVAQQTLQSQWDLRQAITDYRRCLSYLGRYKDVIELDKEEVAVCRNMVEINPGRFKESLASTLFSLASDLHYEDRTEEAAETLKEAIDIERGLAAEEHDPFIENLAATLNQYAWYLANCPGREHESLEPAQEAVALYRKVVEELHPSPYTHPHRLNLNNLANSLDTAAQSLFVQGRYEEALPLIEEAIREIYPQMIGNGSFGTFDHVGSALHQTYGKVLWKLGREAEALEPLQEAVKIYNRLIEGSASERYSRRYARRLSDCANLLEALSISLG